MENFQLEQLRNKCNVLHVNHCFSFILSFHTDRERARYEATVRLGNSSQQQSNERRRLYENMSTVLEKHVSNKLNYYDFCLFFLYINFI